MMHTPRCSRLLPLISLGCLGVLSSSAAEASSSSTGEEYLATTEAVEPNILFVLDLNSTMASPCPEDSDTDTADTGLANNFTDACIDDVTDAIALVTQHFDWARFGVVGTSPDGSYSHLLSDGSTRTTTYDDDFFPIAPLGASPAEISTALAAVTAHSTSRRNLAETLESVALDYLQNTTTDDESDDDLDGFDNDWGEAPLEYWCQETHIIVLTNGRPSDDKQITTTYASASALGTDVTCDTSSGRTTSVSSSDEQCYYDNVVNKLYDTDQRSDLSDSQNVTVHTIGLGIDSSSVAEELFGNASDEISNAGIYNAASHPDSILTGILLTMQDIRSGTFSRSSPVVSADGAYLVYTYYTLNGDDLTTSTSGMALGQGHVRAYEVDDDPTSATYGQVLYNGPTDYGGALWDGGDLLVSRLVLPSEGNPEDRDGVGQRDIYTFWEPAYDLTSTVLSSEGDNDRRMGFDLTFAQEVAADSTVLDQILDTSTDSTGCASDTAYDLSKDGCLIDEDDLQALVDFARGYNDAEFRYMAETRGRWRLGDSPHSVPVVVQARDENYAVDPTYRTFLEGLEANRDDESSPDIVLLAANDGMLHAFRLEEDTSTAGSTEEGEELWAWVPGYLLHREHDAEWAGRLIDLMLYGRTFLFDGSPVVEDVWIDADNDGIKDCTSVPGNCEWRRVVVVQQGSGGPVTLALDITDTNDPTFLWEQTDESDNAAVGHTVGRPVIANVYDASDPNDPVDRWTAFWGSGRGVAYDSSSTDYYEQAEANLYMWHMGDDYFGTVSPAVKYQAPSSSADYARGDNYHPERSDYSASQLQNDSDGASHYEYAYISAALAAVDVDSDGDVDTLYFPVTTTYTPSDEGGGSPGNDVASPGSTWMYKACIDSSGPGDLQWVEFYDPIDDGGLSSRPEVYYAATASWLPDGNLGLYWGTGTPYDRTSSDAGYFFAMKDTAPGDCSGDYMTVNNDCGSAGIYTLSAGEGLTGSPTVYAGVVYFPTWEPDTDLCDGGTGKLYGLAYDDCQPGMDTNGDGVVDTSDDEAIENEDSYISSVTVSDHGTLFYGTSDPDASGNTIGTISAATDPFLGTNTVTWMEVF